MSSVSQRPLILPITDPHFVPTDEERIGFAIAFLKAARDELAKAKAPMTLKKVRSALKSAAGAQNHAWRVANNLSRPMRRRVAARG